MKKGRHRRFEEARALKRSQDVDYDDLFESLNPEDEVTKPEHDAWADLADSGEDSPADDIDDHEEAADDGEAEAESA